MYLLYRSLSIVLLASGLVLLCLSFVKVLEMWLGSSIIDVLRAIGITLTAYGAITVAEIYGKQEIEEVLESRRRHKEELNRLATNLLELMGVLPSKVRVSVLNSILGSEISVERLGRVRAGVCEAYKATCASREELCLDLDNHLPARHRKLVHKLKELCEEVDKHGSYVHSLEGRVRSEVTKFVEALFKEVSHIEVEGCSGYILDYVLHEAVKRIAARIGRGSEANLIDLEKAVHQELEKLDMNELDRLRFGAVYGIEPKFEPVNIQGTRYIALRVGSFDIARFLEHPSISAEQLWNEIRPKLIEIAYSVLKKHLNELSTAIARAIELEKGLSNIQKELIRELKDFIFKTYLPGKCRYIKS